MRSISPALDIIVNYFYGPQKYAKHLKEPFKQFNAFFSGPITRDFFYTYIFLYVDNFTRHAASNHLTACVTITCDV